MRAWLLVNRVFGIRDSGPGCVRWRLVNVVVLSGFERETLTVDLRELTGGVWATASWARIRCTRR
jgi:hypothetical protein